MKRLAFVFFLALLVVGSAGCSRRRSGRPLDGGPIGGDGAVVFDGGVRLDGGGVRDGGVRPDGGGVRDGGGKGFDGGPPRDSGGPLDLTGDWRGSWGLPGSPVGAASATLDQFGAEVTGDITLEASPCGPSGFLYGFLSGSTLTGTIDLDDGSSGDLDATATSSMIMGTANLATGPCAGVFAEFTLTRVP